MTLGREPRPLDWWPSVTWSPLPCSYSGAWAFHPECPKFTGSWKVNISTDPFSFHPNGYHFWKRDKIPETAAQYMWSKQIEMENSSHSDSLPPSLICALDAGDPESSGTLRATCLHRGELWPPQPTCGKCSLGLTRTSKSSSSTTSSSVKLCFSYPPFGLMYIYTYTHKHTYQPLYLHSDSLLN